MLLLLILLVNAKVEDEPDHEERKQLMKDWEVQMADFIPDDMISFEVKKGEVEVLEQYIKHPTNVRGAYFIQMMNKDKIDFAVWLYLIQIKDPRGKLIESKEQKKEAVFSVNITNPGDYKFVFSNEKGKSNQVVTFALDIRNATYEHIKESDLDPISRKLSSLVSGINDLMFDAKFSHQKREGGYEFLTNSNYKYYLYTLCETIIIILVSLWQVYYIKRIVGVNRKIV